jgi:chromosomal replication initiation ATPase DnaA
MIDAQIVRLVTTNISLVHTRHRSQTFIEAQYLRQMAHEFEAVCLTRPFVNQAQLAFTIFARVSAIPHDELRSEHRRYPMVEVRQQGMAFVAVMVKEASYAHIGRIFRKRPFTVQHAVEKFRRYVIEAIQRAA